VYVPGVTTVLGVIGKGDGLLQWGVNTAIDFLRNRLVGALTQEEMDAAFADAKYAHRRIKEEAATAGTLAHKWAEAYLVGNELPLPENEQAARACNAAKAWLASHSWQTQNVERRIYSRKYNYAGTLDYLALIDGERCLCDWKTSKRLYDEYRFQTAAYVQALEEEGEAVSGRWLVRIDKESGDFEAIYSPPEEQEKDFKVFESALNIWRRQQELKPPRWKKVDDQADGFK
jgi:hypothetical protein